MATQLLNTPSTHTWSLVASLDSAWNLVRDTLIDSSIGPVARLAELAVVNHLSRMIHGHLTITTPTRQYSFPTPSPGAATTACHGSNPSSANPPTATTTATHESNRRPTRRVDVDEEEEGRRNEYPDLHAHLNVVHDSFWIRLALMSDLGFAEAFMYGDVECSDLNSLFMLFIYNRSYLSDLNSSLSWLVSLPQKTLTTYRFLNTISNSRSNISAHYDISNRMFEGFLSRDMTYSCAIFEDLDTDLQQRQPVTTTVTTAATMRQSARKNNKNVQLRKSVVGVYEQKRALEWTEAVEAAATRLMQQKGFIVGDGEVKSSETNSGMTTPPNFVDDTADTTDSETTFVSSASSSSSSSSSSPSTSASSAALQQQIQGGQRLEYKKGEKGMKKEKTVTINETNDDNDDEEEEEEDELYTAQMRKIRHIIRKANIQPGHRVLEIGSGWGALAIEAVRLTGCTVDTLTLSIAQKELAEERIRAAEARWEAEGLKREKCGRIRVHLMDYRAMPDEWKHSFDRFVSVEMIEAVGKEFLEEYWRCVDWALKEKDSMGTVQVITIPEARFENYIKEVDFIRKWIFPGGFLPTVTFLIDTLTSGSSNKFVVDSISNIGPHYARTLREWRRRFEARFEDVIVPALQDEYPDVMGRHTGEMGRREIEVFKRKWIYYYCYCEVGFSSRTLGDHILTFTREGISSFGCDVFE